MENKNVFYERGSWYHRTKTLNENYNITYNKRGGFKTPEEAQKSFEKCNQEYINQKQLHSLNIDGDIYLSNYLEYWYENIFLKKNNENTYVLGVAYVIYNLILPSLAKDNYKGDIKLKLLNADYLNSLLEKISKITISAGNRAKEIFSIVINDAIKCNLIKYNPLVSVREFSREKPKINILRKEELKLLLKEAKFDNWYLEILLAVFCGLRKGEIMGLKLSDFDFENKILRVRRQLVNDPVMDNKPEMKKIKVSKYVLTEKPPKKDSYRNLKVPEIIIQEVQRRKYELETFRIGNENFNKKNYISFNRKTGLPQFPNSLNGYLNRVCTRIAIPVVSVHGLRHLFATILIESGVSIEKISALLGHSSIHTTFEIYCDIMEEREKILEFVNRTFNNEVLEAI